MTTKAGRCSATVLSENQKSRLLPALADEPPFSCVRGDIQGVIVKRLR